MKRLLYIAVAVLSVACTADFEEQIVAVADTSVNTKIINSSTGCVEGSIVVRFNNSAESRLAECATRSGATRTGISGVDLVLDEVRGYAVKPVFVVTDRNRERVHAAGLHLWYELLFDEESDVDAVAAKLADVAEVKSVEFVHRVCRINNPRTISSHNIKLSSQTRATNKMPFNDPYNQYQWGLCNLGANSEIEGLYESMPAPVAGADVNVVPAWKLCKGDPSITVAIVDEGVMYTHEDLSTNKWVNSVERDGEQGVDDDKNGYVDDIYGYDFVFESGKITCDKDGDTGHGTHVAGIVTAVNNNGIGICGIAGGSGKRDGVRFMSLQIMSGDSNASDTDVARALQYAADNGAHILQCSWGYLSAESAKGYGSAPGNDKSFKYSCSYEAEAIDYFIANGGTKDGPIDGGVAIFAAGNSAAPLPAYPAAYEPCIAVAAFSPSLRPAYYSDYGIGIDVVAPGGESLLYYNGSIISTVPPLPSIDALYAGMQGTSMACPMVSGVAALGLSYAKQLGKRYTAKEFRSLLLSSTNDIEPYLKGAISYVDEEGKQHRVNYEDYKGKLGAGYIDAYKLLLQIEGTPCKVVKVGETTEIELHSYFGEGIANAQFVSAEVSADEETDAGVSVGEYLNGKIAVTCSKRGVATISVTMLVGGGSLSDASKPFPTEVTRKFVVIAKEETSTNGGWL